MNTAPIPAASILSSEHPSTLTWNRDGNGAYVLSDNSATLTKNDSGTWTVCDIATGRARVLPRKRATFDHAERALLNLRT